MLHISDCSIHRLDNRRFTLPHPNTKGRQTIFDISAQSHFMDERCHQSRARTAQRMSDCDRAAIDVHDIEVKVQIFHHSKRLNGKGFIEFDESNIFHLQARAL